MIRLAFIKYGGLGAGGTERWLQMAAMALPKNKYTVDYFYTDHNVDVNRLRFMQESGVKLVPFSVGSRKNNATQDWEDTDFWEKFDESAYDYVQTAKFCTAEYPYYLLNLPVIERIAFAVDIDRSLNIVYTFTPSNWLRSKWISRGGVSTRSAVLPSPVMEPATDDNLRGFLNLPKTAIVAGFHQRVDDNSYSEIPLKIFAKLENENRFFLIMGGSRLYRTQAESLGLTNVRFIEHDADPIAISRFLNTLDIFAHGRKDGETYGAVFAEALMHGLPCLAHRSTIDNAHKDTMGCHGLFANYEYQYRRYLLKLFLDNEFRSKLSVGAQQFAVDHYGIKQFELRLLAAYERICH